MEPIHFIYLTPAVALVALIFAYMRAAWVRKQDEGNERMKTIGSWVAEGAMAFLGREYRVLVIFVIPVLTWGIWKISKYGSTTLGDAADLGAEE